MAFQRPTLDDHIRELRDSFRSSFATAGRALEAYVRNTTTWVLTRVWGDVIHNLYGLLEWGVRQVVPTLADEAYLLEWGRVYGMSPLPSSPSTGRIEFSGTNGTVVGAGVTVVRADGVQYTTQESGTISAGVLLLAAECDTPGAAGNMGPETPLSLVAPIAGVADVASVDDAADWTNGVDAETTEAFRLRLLERTSRPPQGGASVDYQQWARAVAGVTKAWVHPLGRGAGTVDVYVLHAEGTGIGVPTSGQLAEVQAALAARRPVTADVLAKAPAEVAVAFTLEISPDTSELRAAVEAELDALFLLRAGSGAPIYLSDYWAAVTALVGSGLDQVDMTAPVATTTVAVGEVAVRGVVTWL